MASDEELVRRLARGSEEALAQLMRRFERPLAHFLFRQTGGRDVEDLYQETWLRVVRSASSFQSGKRFSTWLFAIAVNLCRDFLRRQRRAPQVATVEERGSASSELARAEAGLDATKLLARLPDEQREVLILRYYHDLSEGEIAEIAAVPRGTVKSRLHNALAKLAAEATRTPRTARRRP